MENKVQSAASRGAVIREEGEPLLPLSEPHIKQLLAVRWGGRHGGNSSSPWSQYIERRSKEVVVKIETGSLHVPLNTLESRASLAARCANPDGEEVFIVTSARTHWPGHCSSAGSPHAAALGERASLL